MVLTKFLSAPRSTRGRRAVRVHLKGLHSVKAKGRTYCYAWRGGPRVEGEPGSPQFIASYNEAVSRQAALKDDTLPSVLTKYQNSDNFKQLSDRSRIDYTRQNRIIEREFGTFPIGALTDRKARGEFMKWRDRLAEGSRRQADYAWTVLALVLSWAINRGLVEANPCERGGKLYRSTGGQDRQPADEALFLAKAPKKLHLPMLMGLWTGQRHDDLLRLPLVGLRCEARNENKTAKLSVKRS